MDGRRVRHRVAQYLGLAEDDGGAGDAGLAGREPGLGALRDVDGPAARARRQVDRARHGDGLVVIVVFVPVTHADAVRDAAARAGAGAIGDYRACSFSVSGEGRFEPLPGAQPTIGAVGRPEVVVEHRVEVVCPRRLAASALDAMLAAHPYEEPAWHAYRSLSRDELAWG